MTHTARAKPPRPAVQALLDQMAAAMRDARAEQVRIADGMDGSTHYVRWTPALGRVLEPLARLGLAGQLTTCPHTTWTERNYWARWRPGRLRCVACLGTVSAAIRGTREDRICDGCGQLCAPITSLTLLLPPTVLDLGEGPAAACGPVLATFGACSGCRADLLADVPSPRVRS